MAIEFGRQVITIPSGTGPRAFSGSVTFTLPVLDAAVAMEGFSLKFDPAGTTARRVAFITADTQFVNFVGNDVNFQVSVDLEDTTPTEPYSGNVNVCVIAKV